MCFHFKFFRRRKPSNPHKRLFPIQNETTKRFWSFKSIQNQILLNGGFLFINQ